MKPISGQVVVTGAGGFVMSIFIARLLAACPDVHVTGVDLAPLDPAGQKHFAGLGDRFRFVRGDVRDRARMNEIMREAQPELLVNGATITHVPDWEFSRPQDFFDINVTGSLNTLEAARAAGTLRKVIHVSSCAVYGEGRPEQAEQAISETGPLLPDNYYGVSKLAGEMLARRFSQLHGIDVPVVRFTRVFGPMERPTGARKLMHLPYTLMGAMLSGDAVRITRRSRDVTGDWISAEDVADAMIAILASDAARETYNIATGRAIGIDEVISATPVQIDWVNAADDFDFDQPSGVGSLGFCDISAIARDTGWVPRPLAAQVASYVDWAKKNTDIFCRA